MHKMSKFPNWFAMSAQQNFKDHLSHLSGQEGLKFLQLGVYTGDASKWLLDNILTGNHSHLTDVDTWLGSNESAHHSMDFNEVEDVYDNKVQHYHNVTKVKSTTFHFLRQAPMYYFDFIYIDADHTASGVFLDAEMAWVCLKSGGILAFDDYLWSDGTGDENRPQAGIDAFLKRHSRELSVVLKNYQVWVIKV